MTLPTHLFQLPDGRQGAYCDGGDPAGYPVIGLHGTPGCRFSRWPAELPAGRVERVACAVGLAPYGPGGLPHDEWIAGQTAENVQQIEWALEGEEALARGLTASQADLAERLAADPSSLFGDDVPDVDRQFFAQPAIVEEMKLVTAEQAAHGIHGWVDDTLSQLSPWGFDLSQLTVPVLLSYGLKDAFTPPAHGHWLAAHLLTATVQIDTEAGHTGTDYEAELTRELTWLRGA